MTCFWNAILQGLPLELFSEKFNIKYRKPNEKEFICLLKDKNILTKNIKLLPFNIFLNEKRLSENMEWISSLDINSIYNGYYCSSIDPFLCLISELFEINIEHIFYNTKIIFENIKNMNGTLYLYSNNGHCSFKKWIGK